MSRLFSSILFMGAIALTINTAHADGPTPAAPTTVVTKGPCPEGMVVVQGPHVTFDSADTSDDNQNVTAQPGVCMTVSQTLILHASAPSTALEPIADLGPSHPSLEQKIAELGAEIGDLSNEVYEIGSRRPPPAAQAQKLGRWSAGIRLDYPSADVEAVVFATFSGTFFPGSFGELRLEGAAAMSDNDHGLFQGAAIVYGRHKHWFVGAGPSLMIGVAFSKMSEDPWVRHLGAAVEVGYRLDTPANNLDLEMYARGQIVWQRLDRPALEPLRDSGETPIGLGVRALF